MVLISIYLCLQLVISYSRAAVENIVACKLEDTSTFDADGTEVDWFLLYKLPKSTRYAYISPQNQAEAMGLDVGNNESPIKLTLDSFFKLEETQPAQPTKGKKDIYRNQLFQLFYGNDRAESSQHTRHSRSRGVVIAQPAISNRVPNGGAGIAHPEGMFWMTHTVPSFPSASTSAWDPQNNNDGHLFLCLSMENSQLSPLVDTLYYEEPLVYHSNYPKHAFEDETLLQRCEKVNRMECKLHSVYIANAELTTADGMTVSVASENYKLAADIASAWITAKFQSSFYSWNRRSRVDTAQIKDCYGKFQVENLMGPISMAGSLVQHSEDNSRWVVSPNGVWCIVSSHRPKFFEKVSGGAICIRNPQIVNWFKKAMQPSAIQRC